MSGNPHTTMRKSLLLEKLREGKTIGSLKLNLADSRSAEIAALAGIDCIWLDMEHVANDYAAIERQILAAKAYGVDTIVRVPRGSYSDLVRPLELDATGIMVPHVMSLADAQAIVRATKFHPIGRRPVDGGNADGLFAVLSYQEYTQQANRERFVMIQIEDPEPLAELDAIAALDGIDMLMFGPADFSQAIGAPGDWQHERIAEARRLVAEAAIRHGKIAATTAGTLEQAAEWAKLGYRFINIGSDVRALTKAFRDWSVGFGRLFG